MQEKEEPKEEIAEKFGELLDRKLEEKTAALRREFNKVYLDKEILRVSRIEDESELIKFIYNSLIVPTGNLREDIENAKLLANRKRLSKEFSEVEFAKNSNESVSKTGGAGVKTGSKPSLELTASERRFTLPPYNLKVEEIIKSRK